MDGMGLKRASRPDGRCTVKCMLLQKGAVNYCGCTSWIEGAYIRIVGASAPTKRYKITPLDILLPKWQHSSARLKLCCAAAPRLLIFSSLDGTSSVRLKLCCTAAPTLLIFSSLDGSSSARPRLYRTQARN